MENRAGSQDNGKEVDLLQPFYASVKCVFSPGLKRMAHNGVRKSGGPEGAILAKNELVKRHGVLTVVTVNPNARS